MKFIFDFIFINEYTMYIYMQYDEIIKIIIKGPAIKDKIFEEYIIHYIIYTKDILEFHVVITSCYDNHDYYKLLNINIFTDKNLYIDLSVKLDFIIESLKYGTYNNYIVYDDITSRTIILKPQLIKDNILNDLKLNKLNIKLIILESNEIIYNYL